VSEPGIKAGVERALGGITNPRHGRDLVTAGMVKDIVVDEGGAVSFTFVLTREDPGSLARQARKAAEGVPGVTGVKINVVDSADGGGQATARPPGRPAAAPPAPPTPDEMPGLGKVLAVSSGKGGVGKSTVSANLAAALARDGHRVGLMDADIYGPNIPRMFGVTGKPEVQGGKIQPLEAHGVKLMSLGFIVERDAPAIWRGPIIMKIITQFLRDVAWGELDYFLVDLPPGTGDAQLSLTQIVRLHGALIVTTPQEMAVGDSLRGAKMFERVGVGIVGIVENMSYFVCDGCGKKHEIFSRGGAQRVAERFKIPYLGEIPITPSLREGGDKGVPSLIQDPKSEVSQSFLAIAAKLAGQLSIVSEQAKKTQGLKIVSS